MQIIMFVCVGVFFRAVFVWIGCILFLTGSNLKGCQALYRVGCLGFLEKNSNEATQTLVGYL